jgi:hypothetical protein
VANVVIGGTNATVQREGVDHQYEDYGGAIERMEDGSKRDTRKGRKNVWRFVTTLLSEANAATLEAAIVAAPPITCSGDALGASFSCIGVLIAKPRETVMGVVQCRVRFELHEV